MSIEKYKEYVSEHISNVKQVWTDLINLSEFNRFDYVFELDNKNLFISKGDFSIISMNIAGHDCSKYAQEELWGYSQWFYPENEANKNKEIFNYAWNHHQKENSHHWQYWIMWKHDGCIALNMPFYEVIEMLCDWTAMSYKFGDYPSDFYNKNKKEMLLHKNTTIHIEKWLPVFDQLIQIKHGIG